MPRTRTGMQVHLVLGPQSPRLEVEVMGEHRADAIVHGQHPAAAGVGGHHVRVRPGVLDNVGGRAQRPVGIDWEHGDAPRAPVGHQQVPPAWMHRDVDRLGAAAAPRAQQSQRAAHADGERAHQPIGQLMDRVQGPPARRHRQKRRIVRTVHHGLQRQHALTQGRNTDPLAALSGVAAEVDHRVSIPSRGTSSCELPGRGNGPRRRARAARTTH
jgi:hypothetical protein